MDVGRDRVVFFGGVCCVSVSAIFLCMFSFGRFWTNFAATRNPNVRNNGAGSGNENIAATWPDSRFGGIVLNANLPNGTGVEAQLYNNPKICALWDTIAEKY